MSLLSLFNGSEEWTLNISKLKKNRSCKNYLLRFLTGYTFYDWIRIEDIRKTMKIPAVPEVIDGYQNNWHEYILRMLQIEYLRDYSARDQLGVRIWKTGEDEDFPCIVIVSCIVSKDYCLLCPLKCF